MFSARRKIKSLLIKAFGKLILAYHRQIYNSYRIKYQISKDFKFNGEGIKFYGDGQIIIGEHSYIGQFSFLQAEKDYKITIGSNCAISHNVKIYTSSYMSDQNFMQIKRKTHEGNVKIGNGVWIGVNVLINPGIRIGDNAIIGANSVVTKDIPELAIAGGVPARVIRLKNIPVA